MFNCLNDALEHCFQCLNKDCICNMPYTFSTWPCNSNISGRLAEEFCKKYLKAEEPHFEIKSAARKSHIVIVKTWQLLNELHKQYVICVYDRQSRRIMRGLRKGREIYSENIQTAYTHKVSIYVILGFDLLDIVEKESLKTCIVRSKKESWNWRAYYRVPLRCLPDNLIMETENYKLYGQELNFNRLSTESEFIDKVPF